jgi:hypothetical protein
MTRQKGPFPRGAAKAAIGAALVALAACGSDSFAPSSTPATPAPAPSPAVVVTGFALAPGDGTVRAAELQWQVTLRVRERLPGLFVRVDLETGIYGQGEACYASELSVATAIDAQPALRVGAPAFARSPRPGSACDGRTFKPVYAYVRVFDAADAYARQPVASEQFPVAVTVTN